jgi:hypothetical protein
MSITLFIRAEEIAEELGVSKPYAYKLVRKLNEELSKKGFITISGRVSRAYYKEKVYSKEIERGEGSIKMAAFKDKTGTWFTSFRFTDWKGERRQKVKRGFLTKREALKWEREFLQQKTSDLTMTFETFVKIYVNDMQNRIKRHTWQTKSSIIERN